MTNRASTYTIVKSILEDRLLNPTQSRVNSWYELVASDSDIREDYYKNCLGFPIVKFSNKKFKENILIRAIPGHATNGNGIWNSKTEKVPVNTTLDDIIENFNPENFLNLAQNMINQIGNYVFDAINNKPFECINNSDFFLNNLPIFRNIKSYPFLMGFFYGSRFDHPEIRKEIVKEFNADLGYGTTFLFSKNLVPKLGINISEFTSNTYNLEKLNELSTDEKIKIFKELKIINDEIGEIDASKIKSMDELIEQSADYLLLRNKYFLEYFRQRKGTGISDDIACMSASALSLLFKDRLKNENNSQTRNFIQSFMVGANFADFIDTLTKATRYYVKDGFDTVLGSIAENLFRERILNDKDYREEIGINKKRLEKRLSDGDFALVPKDIILILTTLSLHPYNQDIKIYKKNVSNTRHEVHSSFKYFLKITNKKNQISVIEKEYHIALKNIEKTLKYFNIKSNLNIDSAFGKGINEGCKIGYNKVPFKKIVRYLEKHIFSELIPFGNLNINDLSYIDTIKNSVYNHINRKR